MTNIVFPTSFLHEAEFNPDVGSYDYIPADSPRAIASSHTKLRVTRKEPRHVDDLLTYQATVL